MIFGRRFERLSLRRPLDLGYRLQLGLMLAPVLAGVICLFLTPVALSVGLAFTDFDALAPPQWIGARNFERIWRDPDFWNGVRASLVFVVAATPLRLVGALLLALLLHRSARGVGFFRAAVYTPTVMPSVAYALLWLYIFNPLFGPLNELATIFTGPAPDGRPTGWLLHPVAAQAAVVLMALWTIGEGFVILMAALQDTPRELHEAAAIDGADAGQRFAHVTLPLLAPIMLLLAFRDTVASFQDNFAAAIIVTRGGPYYATAYLPYWIYLNATEYQRFGYAAAMNLALLLVTAGVIALQFGFARRWRAAHYYD